MKFLSKILANAGLITNYADFDTASTQVGAVGRMVWNNTDGTVDLGLKGGNVTLQVGQEIVARVVNKSGADLLEANYQVVKVSDAQGQRLAVDLAQANNDLNSADTLGIVTETITNNQEGFITILGQVREINTTGSLQGETWVDGDILYLSSTVAGKITNIKPVAPAHLVILGYVEYAHAIHGKIYAKIQNGYELSELHDVYVPTPTNNNVLVYESATSLWKDKSIATVLGYTPYNAASISGTSGTIPLFGASNTLGNSLITQSGSNVTITGNGVVTGNLTVDTNTFFVDSVNNRVGIGTISPLSGMMHFYGAAGASAVRWSEAATTVGFVGGANGLISGKNGSFMVRGESGLVLSGQMGNSNLFIDSTGDIQTKSAIDTGEHFIIGGTARVNGALASTSTINGVGINAGTINASAYGLLTSANTTYSGTANLLALGTIDGTYNPRVIVSYTTLAGNPALLKFDSTYSSGWGATNYSFATGIVMIGSATVSGSAALQVTGAVTISGSLTGSSTAQFTKIGIGNAPSATSFIFSNVNPTGGTSISAWRGIFSASNDVTSRLNGVSIAVGTQASTTISDIVVYNAEGTSFGAGSSATRVTGFTADSSLANALATNVYGFQGSIASGTNRWNLYMGGTAVNYLNGNLQLGSTTATAGAEKLQVTGTASISGAATFGSSVTAVSLSLTTGNFNLGTSSNAGVVNMYNASTVPSASITNGVILYAQDVDPGTGASSELKVRDEAGNITTLSPHNFSLIPNGPSEELAWSYYSEKKGKKINVDMLKLARLVESLTDEQLVYIQ